MVVLGGVVGKAAERRASYLLPRLGRQYPHIQARRPGMALHFAERSRWLQQLILPVAGAACSPPAHETFGGPCSLCPGLSFLPGASAGISLKPQLCMLIPVPAHTHQHMCKCAHDHACVDAWTGADPAAAVCSDAPQPAALLWPCCAVAALCPSPKPAILSREARMGTVFFHFKVSREAAWRHRAFVQQPHVPSCPGARTQPAVILLRICVQFREVVPGGGKPLLIRATKCHRNMLN